MDSLTSTDDRNSKGPQAVITSVVFLAIAAVAVFLRFATRIGIVRNVGSDDWLILLSWLFSLALTVLVCIEVKHGEGRHIWTISPTDLTSLLKAFWGSIPMYQAGLVLTKLSILEQYRRVFVGDKIKKAIWAMMIITVAYGFWSILSNVFMCAPVHYFWDVTIAGKCMNETAVWFANAGINILTDIAIFLLPMPALKQLQLPKRQKYGLMAVFALGGFVCLVSILRLRSLYVISVSKDVTWDNGPAAYWSSVELNVGILCASLPTLKALISRFAPKFFGQSSAHQSSNRRTTNMGTTLKSRTGKGQTVTEIEMGKDIDDFGGAFDPGRIQVVTVVEQEREELSEKDSSSINSGNKEVKPSHTATAGYAEPDFDYPRPGSKGSSH